MPKSAMISRLLMIGYLFVGILTVLFSYTQVDLSLTLSKYPLLYSVQQSLQHWGYFRRTQTAVFFAGIIFALFALYIWAVRSASKHALSVGKIWSIVGILSVLFLFAYPALSYDFFNYMFTAKTVFVYGKNPYVVTPLMYAGFDPWVNFMRWTHQPSAYAPLWIILTVPAYILGFGHFLIVMFNIKLILIGCYIGTVWAIARILETEEPGRAAMGMAIFALNPLVLIEANLSPHNDIVMMFFAVLALMFHLRKSGNLSYVFLGLSAGIKSMTGFLIPVMLTGFSRSVSLYIMAIAVIIGFSLKELLPWYLLWLIPFVGLNPSNRTALILSAAISFGLTASYLPFLYFGDYRPLVQQLRVWISLVPPVVIFTWLVIRRYIFFRRS